MAKSLAQAGKGKNCLARQPRLRHRGLGRACSRIAPWPSWTPTGKSGWPAGAAHVPSLYCWRTCRALLRRREKLSPGYLLEFGTDAPYQLRSTTYCSCSGDAQKARHARIHTHPHSHLARVACAPLRSGGCACRSRHCERSSRGCGCTHRFAPQRHGHLAANTKRWVGLRGCPRCRERDYNAGNLKLLLQPFSLIT